MNVLLKRQFIKGRHFSINENVYIRAETFLVLVSSRSLDKCFFSVPIFKKFATYCACYNFTVSRIIINF